MKSWKEEFQTLSAGGTVTRSIVGEGAMVLVAKPGLPGPSADFGALSLSGVEDKAKGFGSKLKDSLPKDPAAWAKQHWVELLIGALVGAAVLKVASGSAASKPAFGGTPGGWRHSRAAFERGEHHHETPFSQRLTLRP